jgi:hypothetical protein
MEPIHSALHTEALQPAKPFSQLVYPEAMTLNGTDPSKIGPTERMQDRAW